MDMNLNSKWSIVVFHKSLYWDLCSFSYIYTCIKDLTKVSSFFMPILFADDTNLFCTGTDLKETILLVNEEISKIYAWVNANRLSLNIDKINFMLFSPKKVFSLYIWYCDKPNQNTGSKRNKIPWCHHGQQAKVVYTYHVHQQKDC